jgi:hypothetical protein
MQMAQLLEVRWAGLGYAVLSCVCAQGLFVQFVVVCSDVLSLGESGHNLDLQSND